MAYNKNKLPSYGELYPLGILASLQVEHGEGGPGEYAVVTSVGGSTVTLDSRVAKTLIDVPVGSHLHFEYYNSTSPNVLITYYFSGDATFNIKYDIGSTTGRLNYPAPVVKDIIRIMFDPE